MEKDKKLIIKIKAKTLDGLFIECAKKLFILMVDIETVLPRKNAKISLTANNSVLLLENYLNSLIDLKKSKGMFYSQFRTKVIEKTNENNEKYFCLEGVVFGEKMANHTQKYNINKVVVNSFNSLDEKDSFLVSFSVE